MEAAWNYRYGARVSRRLEVRQHEELKVIRDIDWRAQLRLTKRYRHLSSVRSLARNKVCVAIARELCGFIWDIARNVMPVL